MATESTKPDGQRPRRDPLWWHLLLIVALSAGYESLFLHHGLNWLDEAWPLYAAMQLHDGGVLYDDVFFVFPPGHLLSAWLAYAIDPPGVVLARAFYGAFNVALCAALYLLGRRLMPASFALLAASMLALANPISHIRHYLFGYRYLVFSVLALLAFATRLRSGDQRWMLVVGALVGVAFCFRLTPALALIGALGLGTLVSARSGREFWNDAVRLALGFAIVVAVVTGWLLREVDLATLWREVVVRPVSMTNLQSRPVPELGLLDFAWGRKHVNRWFVAVQFRAYPALYAGYIVALVGLWIRSRLRPGRFEHALLLTLVVWGGVFFLRSLGRSDQAHLDSTLPPTCLLMAHLLYLVLPRPRARGAPGATRGAWIRGLAWSGALAVWLALHGSLEYLKLPHRQEYAFKSLDGVVSTTGVRFRELDELIMRVRRESSPGDRIFDLSYSPIIYVLAPRLGPGHADVVLPGTFMDEDEQLALLDGLQRDPPALVVMPTYPFDRIDERGVHQTASLVVDWILRDYELLARSENYRLLEPSGKR